MRHARLVFGLVVLFALLAGSARAGISKDILKDILLHEQSRSTEDGALAKYAQDKKADVRARAYRALGRMQDVKLPSMYGPSADENPFT